MSLVNLTIDCATARNAGLKYLHLIETANLTSMTLSSGSTSDFVLLPLLLALFSKQLVLNRIMQNIGKTQRSKDRPLRLPTRLNFMCPALMLIHATH